MENFLGFFIVQCLNALSQASLLFLIAVGLTLIFGIMRVINFAHGTIYMLGAYIGFKTVDVTGSFWLALIVAPIIVGAIGAVFERFLSPGCTAAMAALFYWSHSVWPSFLVN